MFGNWRTASAIGSLFAANLFADFALWACVRFWSDLTFVGIGILICQVLLLAVWLSWGEGRWYWRCVAAVLATALVGRTAELAAGDENSPLASFALIALLFVLVALMLPLRRVRGWRLTNWAETEPLPLGRFQIGDIMLWTAIVALPLGLDRIFAMEFEEAPPALALTLLVVVAALGPLFWPALIAAFAPVRARRILLTSAWLFAYSSALVTAALYFYYLPVIAAFGTPGWIVMLQIAAIVGSFCIVVPSALVANAAVLRALGWRLVRPAWRSSAAPLT